MPWKADGSLGQKNVEIATPGVVQLEGMKKAREKFVALKIGDCSMNGQIRSSDEKPIFPPLQSIAGGRQPLADS